jgi:lipopolysaccharide transport system permease protein
MHTRTAPGKVEAGGTPQGWDIVITPRTRWFELDLAGVWRYRDLVWLLFKRDFVAFYKQTILGPVWYIIQPILTAIAFTLIFSRIARISTDEVPAFVFYMSGVVFWNFFATCLSKNSDTFTANSAIFSKVYFPRLVVPVSVIMSNLLTFTVQFVMLLLCMAYYWWVGAAAGLQPAAILIVPLLAYLALFGLGCGIVISALTTRYRDLAFVVGFATQLWMYATPIVYPLSQIPERWHWLYLFNPMTAPAETFRLLLLGRGTVTLEHWLASAVTVVVVVFIGLAMFARTEKTSMDTV